MDELSGKTQKPELECLHYIGPDDIDTVWPAILPGLEILRKKIVRKNRDHRPPPWTDEKLKTALKAGIFDLLLAYRNGKFEGWTMITRFPEEFSEEPILFIITGWSKARETTDAAMRDYERIARFCGIKRIGLCSSFKGWERTGKKYGFAPTKTWYEKRLD